MSTVLVLLGVCLLAAWAACELRRDKKSGKSSCGGNCGGCSACGVCHQAAAKNKGKLLSRVFTGKTRKPV